MSRALESDLRASLRTEDLQSVYDDIVRALSTEKGELLEIEFLGKSHPLPTGCNVLVDGNSVAVSKGKLVQAFIVARNLFFQLVKEECSEDQCSKLRDATSVILLMDAEHITAANARKNFIKRYQNGPKDKLEAALKKELLFVDSFLTSHLHRHTKSPTLWGHRRWILEVCKSIQTEHDIYKDLLSVVFIAAERHPRNYYAWSHMRWLVAEFGQNISPDNRLPKVPAFDKFKLLSAVKDWCLRHPGDTSGFSFLLFCLSRVETAEERREVSSSVCGDVLRLAVSFKWTRESVWVFLRTLVASGEVEAKDREAFFQAFESTSDVRFQSNSTVVAAQHWVAKYERQEA